MRVAVFNGAGKPVTIEDRPEEDLGPGDVRLAIGRCGVCGSDISMTSGSAFDYAPGCVIGHEYAGEVIEVGRDVAGIRTGDRLAVIPSGPCGKCAMCHAGRALFCFNGRSLFGGFGERKVVPASAAFRLPDSVSLTEGALAEPVACGRRALRMAGFKKGQKILVIGAGSMALAVIYWARLMGAGKIAVLTRSGKRDEVLRTFGADATIRLDNEDRAAVSAALGGEPDIVAECVGKTGMLHLAIERAPIGASIVSLGMCTLPDPVIPALGSFREISLHFPIGYSAEDFTETLRAFDAGSIRPEAMVSTTIALDELPAMIEEMRGPNAHLKVMVDPHRKSAHGS
ncbi:MAG: alcohol dehydrogenase catalytic domain-containing protein [Novosphingobium sp.]|nr:alcohol dehydrogenase catalytic domain-containing protein [Novosphingobium sp.]